METRRKFILQAGAVILAAPALSTLKLFRLPTIDLSDLSGSDDSETADLVAPIDRTLERLLEEAQDGNPFVAKAADNAFINPIQLMSAPNAFLTIYDRLGLKKSFSGRVDYRESSQCRENFQRHEADFRKHYNYFTDIERSLGDRDVAYLAAGNFSGSTLQSAQGAAQYRSYRSVGLSADDPGIVLAASTLLNHDYNPDYKEVAQSFAVTSKSSLPLGDGQYGMRYETPVQSFIHDPRPRPRYPRGIVVAHNKKNKRNPNNLYSAGLYV